MQPTLRDVAAEARVSVMTASRALRDSSLLAPETHRRVLEACEKVGYRPNVGARATREQRFRQIACVILQLGERTRPSWPVTYCYVNALAEELADHGYSLVLQPFRLAPGNFSFIEPPRVFYESAVDGIIAIASTSQVPPEVHDSLASLKLPMAWLNSGQFKSALCFVSDERTNAKILVDHLVELGHRRIGYVGSTVGHYSAKDRYDGVVAALKAAGLETNFCVRTALDQVQYACDDVLAHRQRPTAIITFNAQLLQTVQFYANVRRLAVPEDISLACFASPWLMDGVVAPTFVEVPERTMAQKAVPLMIEQIDSKSSRRTQCHALAGILRQGATTGPPPSGKSS